MRSSRCLSWPAGRPLADSFPRRPAPPVPPSSPRCSALFERATHLSLPPKKMKFLFKRYLEFERGPRGSAAGAEHVKRRAMEYVEAQAAA